ncbi:hypothetical protein F2Q70_00015169 [Brassica cretica]|uniref:Uncharacterized protein n=1 Tax=Brassica cretica TaxID=69181 RepID=A0A8S9HXT6_BRACR|nr:hypothetical protein F2Q70_00015169 [Brassica cretica]
MQGSENREVSPPTTTRIRATLRLGAPIDEPADMQEDMPIMKKKPGRPPGKRKVANSPRTVAGTSARKRKGMEPGGSLYSGIRKLNYKC